MISYTDQDRAYDGLLVTLARGGDQRAAERLAARWYPRLRRTAHRILRNADQADDAVQDAWSGICRGWLSLSDPDRFGGWAYRVLQRKCTDRIRSAIRERDRTEPLPEFNEASTVCDYDAPVALQQAFDALSPDHRFAAILYFVEGHSLQDVAQACDVPLGTAKSRIFHARKHMKLILKGDES
ncbi:MAG: RNA polymerase sigma factor [Pseudomonadota bacterium]